MKRLLSWWDSTMMPKYDDTSATSREQRRRSLLISRVILLFLCLDVLSSPLTFFLDPILWLTTTGIAACIFLCALVLNKKGKTTLAGFILVASAFVAHAIPSLSGLDGGTLPVLSLLIVPLILSCAILAPKSVFVQLSMNFLVIVFALLSPLNDPIIREYVRQNTYVAFVPHVALEIDVAVIVYIVVLNLVQTMREATQAEEQARFLRTVAQQEHEIAEQHVALVLEQITEIARRVQADDFRPLPALDELNLEQVTAVFKLLLARVERLTEQAEECRQLKTGIEQLASALRHARSTHQPFHMQPTGTVLDPLIQEVKFSSTAALRPGSSAEGLPPGSLL